MPATCNLQLSLRLERHYICIHSGCIPVRELFYYSHSRFFHIQLHQTALSYINIIIAIFPCHSKQCRVTISGIVRKPRRSEAMIMTTMMRPTMVTILESHYKATPMVIQMEEKAPPISSRLRKRERIITVIIPTTSLKTNLMNKRTKQLQQENNQLRKTIHDLQSDHRKLLLQLQAKQQKQSPPPPPSSKVVLERFEGERRPHRHATPTGDDVEYGSTHSSNINRNSTKRYSYNNNNNNNNNSNENQVAEDQSLLWCDVPNAEDGTCPVEPDIDFTAALRDRAIWLVSLLVLQSISGIILYRNELVLSNHPSST
jgi:hypothetical protein